MKVSIMKVQILKMFQIMKIMKDMTVNACKTQLIQHLIMIPNDDYNPFDGIDCESVPNYNNGEEAGGNSWEDGENYYNMGES